jgi:heme exporter protein CcmD
MMGEYAQYIVVAYAVALVVLSILLVRMVTQHRHSKTQLEALTTQSDDKE